MKKGTKHKCGCLLFSNDVSISLYVERQKIFKYIFKIMPLLMIFDVNVMLQMQAYSLEEV